MNYSEFIEVYEELSETTKKLGKTDILADFLKKLKEHSEWIYLLRGRVVADYDEREFGISTQLVIKAISRASGISIEKVVEKFRKIGDLGEVAEEFIKFKKQNTLFSSKLKVDKVFTNLTRLMDTDGKGSVDKKLDFISELLTSASGKEAKYIIRTLLNDLRVGVADAILRDSIAKAFFENEDEMRDIIDEAYDKVNDFAEVYERAIKGKSALHEVDIKPGRPMKVMLPVKVLDLDEALRICGETVAVEHKYDGFRVVISNDGRKIDLFTRRLDNVTKQFSDVVSVVKDNVKGKSYVLDSEVVGYDPKSGKYKPFEAISQRIRRKYDIDKLIRDLPVEINVFDILFYNGKSTMGMPFLERRKLLEKIIKIQDKKIRLSTQFVSNDKDKIMKFYKDALKIGEEGIMIKNISAHYRPGRRVGYMVKIKPVVNDLDLVIIGAEYGTGKRAGGLTSFIVACRDGKDFLEVGKVSSGLKEKESEGTTYKEINNLLTPLIIKKDGTIVHVKPKVIVSVTYQNMQKSPSYSSGFAMRFPRITHYRPERGIYDIATIEDIKKEAGKERR
ncbi:hypothetical protein AUJ84_00685 [Candidatus Pacearchaeota archaeon CG1_02_32_132]|nr:MAG: hypothetical protein AUJ84_00685 [Candidatus Pacearchaeota archaeon CG1_02_32_132]